MYGRVPGAILGGMLFTASCTFALNPALDTSQYAHTAWKIRDGFTKGSILSIAQTPDGYLWLGTAFGLSRFDGVRNVPWQPSQNQHLPSDTITKLVAARDGTLWIGTWNGLASWKNGRLTEYTELAGSAIFALAEDHNGSIWAGANGPSDGKLCEIRTGNIQCHSEMGDFGHGVLGLHEDGNGSLWIGFERGVCRWRPGPPEFYAVPSLLNGRMQGLAEGDDGALLIATTGAVMRLVDRKAKIVFPFPGARRGFRVLKMLRDHDGGLWIGPAGRGIVHIHQGRTDVFSQLDGLSGDDIYDLFEDREGDIWVATINGLDRFRELPVTTYSTKQGLSDIPWGGVLAGREGNVWFATLDGLHRLDHGRITVYRHGHVRTGVREIAGSGLPDEGVGSLFQDSRGRIWVSTPAGIGYLENNRFVPTAAPAGTVRSLTEDTSGNLWIANNDLGLFRLSPSDKFQRILWATFGRTDPAVALAPDPLHGLWLGFFQGGVAWFRDGRVHSSYSAADGLGEGRVNQLRFDAEGSLWIATDSGLSRLKNGRIITLTSKNGLPCDAVQWTVDDDTHSVWLMVPCGLVRVARSELDAWASAGKAGRSLHATVFDSSDGLRTLAVVGDYTPRVAKSPDGKVWFGAPDGISVFDPRHIPFNKVPPPVHIENITADRNEYWRNSSGDAPSNLRLRPLVRDLTIDYTALSLVAPEKIRFRYKLEGRDRNWRDDLDNRRQALYSDLPPRAYRFRVRACNNSGLWNEAGASLDFSIEPAYYQTRWFRALCAAALLALVWASYRYWLRHITREFNVRLEERVGERTRIARELHDTLLQSFQAALIEFKAASNLFAKGRQEAIETLESAITTAQQAIVAGRDAIQDLRLTLAAPSRLENLLKTTGEEIARSDISSGNRPEFRVTVEGTPEPLSPILQDEVFQIGREALRNAFRHAGANRIEAEIRYGDRQFRLRIRDDGKGVDRNVLLDGLRAGHWGLPGMRERAKRIGARLVFWSEAGAGTEVEVLVASRIAYAKSRARRRFGLFHQEQ